MVRKYKYLRPGGDNHWSMIYKRGSYEAPEYYYPQLNTYSHNDERCVKYWNDLNADNNGDLLREYINKKRYNKYKDEEYCLFKFDKNVDCIEHGR